MQLCEATQNLSNQSYLRLRAHEFIHWNSLVYRRYNPSVAGRICGLSRGGCWVCQVSTSSRIRQAWCKKTPTPSQPSQHGLSSQTEQEQPIMAKWPTKCRLTGIITSFKNLSLEYFSQGQVHPKMVTRKWQHIKAIDSKEDMANWEIMVNTMPVCHHFQ